MSIKPGELKGLRQEALMMWVLACYDDGIIDSKEPWHKADELMKIWYEDMKGMSQTLLEKHMAKQL